LKLFVPLRIFSETLLSLRMPGSHSTPLSDPFRCFGFQGPIQPLSGSLITSPIGSSSSLSSHVLFTPCFPLPPPSQLQVFRSQRHIFFANDQNSQAPFPCLFLHLFFFLLPRELFPLLFSPTYVFPPETIFTFPPTHCPPPPKSDFLRSHDYHHHFLEVAPRLLLSSAPLLFFWLRFACPCPPKRDNFH